ncbi:MAG TPA: hypothetical protein VD926_07580 [Acidimicrobiales bacterium]|nr:hypothetical protein [Acidimicrobiales bacterium]
MRRLLLPLAVLGLAGGACSDGAPEAAGSTAATTAPTTTTAVRPGALDLTEEWGCGGVLALSTRDEATALFVHVDFDRVWLDEAEPGPLVGGDWVAELRSGSNLFANWCTDVITEPFTEVEATVPVEAGSIEVTRGGVRQHCGGPFVAQLHDVRLADGRRLGDLTVHTRRWGCVQG